MSRLVLLGVCAVALASATTWALEPVRSKDWPQWRGPGRENRSASTGLSTDWEAHPPTLAWKVASMGKGYASVSIVGDRLYTTGNHGDSQHVTAVDLKSHKVLWSQPVVDFEPKHGYEGSRCTPAVDGDKLYVVTSNGGITCVNVANGKVVWQRDFKEFGGKMMSGWGFSESPLVDGDRVLCTPGGDDAMIVALDKQTGKNIWKSAVADFGEAGKPGAGYSSIVISDAAGVKQYVTLVGRGAIGVRASDGKLLWTYNRVANPVANIPTPLIAGDYVFTSSGYDQGGTALLKLSRDGDGVSATEVYYHPAREMQNHHGGMVLVGDQVFMGHGHNNGFPMCIDLATGNVLWGGKIRGAGSGSAGVTYADKHIIFRYQSGDVALVDASTNEYKLRGSFKPEVVESPSWAHPVVVGNTLYLREQDTLMAYEVGKK